MLARAHLSLEDQRPTVGVTILIEIGDIRPHVNDLLRTGLSRDWTACTLVGGIGMHGRFLYVPWALPRAVAQ